MAAPGWLFNRGAAPVPGIPIAPSAPPIGEDEGDLTPAEMESLKFVAKLAQRSVVTAQTVISTLVDCGSSVAQLCIGLEASRRAQGIGAAPPIGGGIGPLFALYSLVDIKNVGGYMGGTLKSLGNLSVNPSWKTLETAVVSAGEATKSCSRLVYLGSVMNLVFFNPVLHVANLGATLGCAVLGGLSAIRDYAEALKCKEDAITAGETERADAMLHAQITCLLRIAENVALVAFATISMMVAPCSMLPVTVYSGIAMAAAAALSLAANLHDSLNASYVGLSRAVHLKTVN